MKDFANLAKASGLDVPDRELDRITQPLALLEEAFRPLVKDLPPDLEPAPELHLGEDA